MIVHKFNKEEIVWKKFWLKKKQLWSIKQFRLIKPFKSFAQFSFVVDFWDKTFLYQSKGSNYVRQKKTKYKKCNSTFLKYWIFKLHEKKKSKGVTAILVLWSISLFMQYVFYFFDAYFIEYQLLNLRLLKLNHSREGPIFKYSVNIARIKVEL